MYNGRVLYNIRDTLQECISRQHFETATEVIERKILNITNLYDVKYEKSILHRIILYT